MPTPLYSPETLRTLLMALAQPALSIDDGMLAIEQIANDYEAATQAALREAAATFARMTAQVEAVQAQYATLLIKQETYESRILALMQEVDEIKHLLYLATRPDADCYVHIDPIPTLISSLEIGITHVDAHDLRLGNPVAVARAKALIGSAVRYQHQAINMYSGGEPWPWPGTGSRSPEPSSWMQTDAALQMILDMGSEIILNLWMPAWWMKARLLPDGRSTPLVYPVDRYSGQGRLMTSRQADWLLMVQRACERYMRPPYNVRWFVSGIELHGYELGRDLTFNSWAYTDFAGTPGDRGDMGAAHFHNITMDRVLEVATAQGIAHDALTISYNYPRISTWGTGSGRVPVDHPLRDRVWGSVGKVGLDAFMQTPMALKRVDRLSFDFGSLNKDGYQPATDLPNLEKFTDVCTYLMEHRPIPGLPLDMMEAYIKPVSDPALLGYTGLAAQQYRAMIKAEAFRRMMLAGISLVLLWSPIGRADEPGNEYDGGLISSVATATGGQAQPALEVVKMFHDHFAPGSPVYDVEIEGTGLSAVASNEVLVLISQSASEMRVCVGETVTTLGPYQVQVVAR